jgi:hypothetical protein
LTAGEAQQLQSGMRVSYEYSRGERGPIAPILLEQILPSQYLVGPAKRCKFALPLTFQGMRQ